MKYVKLIFAATVLITTISSTFALNLKSGLNKVSFLSEGEKIAASLYIPKKLSSKKKYPAIVVTPPATGVKEQTAGLYAEKLSKEGFVTLAFDPAGWGESDGHKSLYNPYKVAENTKSAVSYIRTIKYVDKEKVYNVGICMGAGISGFATAYDSRVKALAVISPYLDAADAFLKQLGGSANMRAQMLPLVANARQTYFETGKDIMRKMVPETEEEIKTGTPVGIGMREYYLPGKPGGVPNWRNEQSLIAGDLLLSFSIYNYMHMFDAIPVYVVYGDKAVTAEGAKRFYEGVKGPKDKLAFKDAGHFDIYWKEEYVNSTVKGIVTFFKKNAIN